MSHMACIAVGQSVCLSLSLSISIHLHLSVCCLFLFFLFFHLSVCCSFVCLSVCLSDSQNELEDRGVSQIVFLFDISSTTFELTNPQRNNNKNSTVITKNDGMNNTDLLLSHYSVDQVIYALNC